MVRLAAIFSGLSLFLISCNTTETEKETISEEHASLIGTWQEGDSLDTTIWTFDQYEVKWKGFKHFYEVSGDSLIISGLVYQIVEHSDEQIQLLKFNGKPCTLNRKEQ